jgi:hypothetical protein
MNETILTWGLGGLAAWACYFGCLGWYVATVKRREPLEGILLAVLAGPVGLLLIALFPMGEVSPAAVVEPVEPEIAAKTTLRPRPLLGQFHD